MAKKTTKSTHTDEIEDTKLIKKMVKGDCLNGKSAKKRSSPKKKSKR